jgi:GNAT superfamily N-acetyltransferase
MLWAELSLAQKLEAADAALGADYALAYAKAYPAGGGATIPVMGGRASFAGVDSPMTQAFALGLSGPVTAEELDELEEFYRRRGAAVNIELCPLADESLRHLPGERGYRIIEFSNVLVRELTPEDVHIVPDPAVKVRQAGSADAEVYGDVASRGFFEHGDIPQFMKEVAECFTRMTMMTQFLAELDGRVAGGGGVGIHGEVATFAGAATLPEFRNRGVQKALIQARLAFAAAAGCKLAMVTTMPGSGSYRNAARQGFRIVYTRCKLMLPKAE